MDYLGRSDVIKRPLSELGELEGYITTEERLER